MSEKRDLALKKIVKFIDYIYLHNFITNMMLLETSNLNKEQSDIDWKIFSTQCVNDKYNIMFFIKMFIVQRNYKHETLLTSIHIYSKICKKYAHLINNYTFLFVSVYNATNKILSDDNSIECFMTKILNIPVCVASKMTNIIDEFMIQNDIYFDPKEKERIICNIMC